MQAYDPSLEATLLCGLSGGGHQARRQPSQLCAVGQVQYKGIVGGQLVLAKLQREVGQAARYFAEALLSHPIEASSVLLKSTVGFGEQGSLLGVQPQGVAGFPHCTYAIKELGVEVDVVAEIGEQRRHLAHHGL